MQAGLVTVMIPSYNYAQYLRECVESAVGQEHADVVIVDNGSTDASPDIGRELADRYANARFVQYEDNQGIITSFTRCRQEVHGEYAVLLCADDCLTPGSLARSRALMDAHPGVGLVYGPATFFATLDGLRPEQLEGAIGPPIVYDGDRWIEQLCRTGVNPILTPEAFTRTSVLQRVGGYEPRTPYTSDLNLWLRIASVADVGFLRGPSQALFRRHETNEGTAYPNASAAELTQRWAAYATFFETLRDDPRRIGWEGLARRRLGREARYSATRAFVRFDDEGVQRLLDLADEINPADPTGERLGWAIRRRLGPQGARRFPGLIPRPVVHRLGRMKSARRRQRSGVG